MNARIAIAVTLLLAGCGSTETGRRAAEFNARQEKAQQQRLKEATVRMEKTRPDVRAAYASAPREIGGKLERIAAPGEAPDYSGVDRRSVAKAMKPVPRIGGPPSQAQAIAAAEKRRKEILAEQAKTRAAETAKRLAAIQRQDAAQAKRYRPTRIQKTPLQKSPATKAGTSGTDARRTGTTAATAPKATSSAKTR